MKQVERREVQIDDEDQFQYTEVFSWGSDEEGQMGLGENKRNTVFYFPRICSFSIVIHQLSCGVDHTAFVAKNGYLYTMGIQHKNQNNPLNYIFIISKGSNALGKLGLGQQSLQNSFSPQLVNALSKYKVMQVSCGYSHTCCVIDSGELFSWGDSSEGQLGINSNGSFYLPQLVNFSDIKGKQNTFVADVSCGYYHTAVVLRNGQVCAFGNNKKGQIGNGNFNKQFKPVLIHSLNQIIKVKCGQYHTLFLDDSGRVYSTGLNDEGQLGLGYKDNNICSPKHILELEHIFVKKIFAGSHSVVISDSHDVYFFGQSNVGQFLYPQLIKIGTGMIKDISIGNDFGIALTSDGKVYSWGVNDQGQLGLGDSDIRLMPSLVESLLEKKVQHVSCGNNYVICLGQNRGKQQKTNQSIQQKGQFKYQSPNNIMSQELKEHFSSNQIPQKGMIKSQSQLIVANQVNMMEDIQRQTEQNQQNGIFTSSGFNKQRSSKSVHSPQIDSEIFGSNTYSPEKIQQNNKNMINLLNTQIKSQKEVIFNNIIMKNVEDKLQNNQIFQSSLKKQKHNDSIGQLSTKEGIKQSPTYFDLQNSKVQDFSKQLSPPNKNHYGNNQVTQNQAIINEQQEKQALIDKINSLENQIDNKNEYIKSIQNEMKQIKNMSPNKTQNNYIMEQQEQLKREKCDLMQENNRLQEDNSQFLNVLQQQADQISELMKENRELNVKLQLQMQQHEIQNKQVNQKLLSYTEKIQEVEKIYSQYNTIKGEIKIKDERIQQLEDQVQSLKNQQENYLKKNSPIRQSNGMNESLKQYMNILDTPFTKQRVRDTIKKPLSIDITNFDTVKNNTSAQDQVSFRRGHSNNNFFNQNQSQLNENYNPPLQNISTQNNPIHNISSTNKNQILADKYQSMNLNLTNIYPNMTNINQNPTGINQNISGMNQNANGLHQNANGLHQNMIGLNQNLSNRNQILSNRNQNLGNINSNLASINQNLSNKNRYKQINYQDNYVQPTYTPQKIQAQPDQQLQMPRSSLYNQYEQDIIYPYQSNSILKNSPMKSKNRKGSDEPRNVSFTDLDQANGLSSSRSRNSKDYTNTNGNIQQMTKAKSFSSYQPNAQSGGDRKNLQVSVYPDTQNTRPVGSYGTGLGTPISTKTLQSPQNMNPYTLKQNLFNGPQSSSSTQAQRHLEFMNFQKQQNPTQSDLEFQKSINRTKKHIESRMNELNRKLTSQNMY